MYDEYGGVGISHARPLTVTEKGFLLAGTTLLAPLAGPLFGIGAAGGRGFHFLWKTRPVFIYAGLSPGGGGPGSYPTSATILLDDWSNPLLRGYRPSHGY